MHCVSVTAVCWVSTSTLLLKGHNFRNIYIWKCDINLSQLVTELLVAILSTLLWKIHLMSISYGQKSVYYGSQAAVIHKANHSWTYCDCFNDVINCGRLRESSQVIVKKYTFITHKCAIHTNKLYVIQLLQKEKFSRSYWDLNSDFWIQSPMCSPLHHRTTDT